MNIYICSTCGYVAFDTAPETCPVCGTPKEDFNHNNNIFIESKEKSPEAEEKHLPRLSVVRECGLIEEVSCTDVLIRIGEVLHPMQEQHFIQFVDCYLDGTFVERMEFTPYGVQPAGCLHLKSTTGTVTVVEHCNIHGYWKNDVSL